MQKWTVLITGVSIVCVDYKSINSLACVLIIRKSMAWHVLTMGNSMDNLTKGHNSVTLLDKIMYFYGIKLHRRALASACGALVCDVCELKPKVLATVLRVPNLGKKTISYSCRIYSFSFITFLFIMEFSKFKIILLSYFKLSYFQSIISRELDEPL